MSTDSSVNSDMDVHEYMGAMRRLWRSLLVPIVVGMGEGAFIHWVMGLAAHDLVAALQTEVGPLAITTVASAVGVLVAVAASMRTLVREIAAPTDGDLRSGDTTAMAKLTFLDTATAIVSVGTAVAAGFLVRELRVSGVEIPMVLAVVIGALAVSFLSVLALADSRPHVQALDRRVRDFRLRETAHAREVWETRAGSLTLKTVYAEPCLVFMGGSLTSWGALTWSAGGVVEKGHLAGWMLLWTCVTYVAVTLVVASSPLGWLPLALISVLPLWVAAGFWIGLSTLELSQEPTWLAAASVLVAMLMMALSPLVVAAALRRRPKAGGASAWAIARTLAYGARRMDPVGVSQGHTKSWYRRAMGLPLVGGEHRCGCEPPDAS